MTTEEKLKRVIQIADIAIFAEDAIVEGLIADQKVIAYKDALKILTDHNQQIIKLIDEMIDKHKDMQKKYLDYNLEYYGLTGAKISTLTELKQKIESL